MAQYIPNIDKNFQPAANFEGFNPYEMYNLLYVPYDEEKSPLRLNLNLSQDEFLQMKFYSHMIEFLVRLQELQPLKLTQLGNLPRKFCRTLYDSGVKDHDIWAMSSHPIHQEQDSTYIHVLNLITKDLGLTRKRLGKLYLTRKGAKHLLKQDNSNLFRDLFQWFTGQFNWGYTDGYPEAWIIQGGFAFSILLVQRYGETERSPDFYGKKFMTAFPQALEEFKDSYISREEHFIQAYALRTFQRFLEWFGLVEVSKDKHFATVLAVKKGPLIDKVFEWDNF